MGLQTLSTTESPNSVHMHAVTGPYEGGGAYIVVSKKPKAVCRTASSTPSPVTRKSPQMEVKAATSLGNDDFPSPAETRTQTGLHIRTLV